MDAFKPRLLVVEDDLITVNFIRVVLESIPAIVDTTAYKKEALDLARTHHYDGWLFDVHLADGKGIELLQELRQEGRKTPALAHTAESSTAVLNDLINQGFDLSISKPLTSDQLLRAANKLIAKSKIILPLKPSQNDNDISKLAQIPLWNNESALRAMNGASQHVKALRELFLRELHSMRLSIEDNYRNNDVEGMRKVLHQLTASCGFVGADRLAHIIRQLHINPNSAQYFNSFVEVSRETLEQAK